MGEVIHVDFTVPNTTEVEVEDETLIDSMYAAVCGGMLAGLEVDDVLADMKPIHEGGDTIVKEDS